MKFTEEQVKRVAYDSWKNHADSKVRYEDLKPSEKDTFNSVIRYAMNRAVKFKVNS